MIPRLIANENFYKTIQEDDNVDINILKEYEEPIEEFLKYNVPVYLPYTDTWVGKGKIFEEYNHARLDEWGCCPSVNSLISFLTDHINSENTKYLVTSYLVNMDIVEENESYSTYIDDNGESTDMDFLDYVEKYGRPSTQFENMLLSFNIYILE